MEDAGFEHPVEINVVVVQAGDGYKYDVLTGFVDLSGYAASEKARRTSPPQPLRSTPRETLEEIVCLWTASIPETAISVEYWVEKGKR